MDRAPEPEALRGARGTKEEHLALERPALLGSTETCTRGRSDRGGYIFRAVNQVFS